MKRSRSTESKPKAKSEPRRKSPPAAPDLRRVIGGAWNCYVEVAAVTTGDVSG